MSNAKIYTKPLSVNECRKGRRFKTQKYKDYREMMMIYLPTMEIPDGKLSISIEYGFSSSGIDVDNPTKPFLDCMQDKYHINDSRIYELIQKKVIVKK